MTLSGSVKQELCDRQQVNFAAHLDLIRHGESYHPPSIIQLTKELKDCSISCFPQIALKFNLELNLDVGGK